jgi:hypothetical protein
MSLLERETQLETPIFDIPDWSENFCLSSFDPTSGAGLWLHLGRWRRDLTWWRETVVVMLPDGTVATHRAFGNALTTPDGPGGPNFAVRIVQPGKRLRYLFSSGVRRVPAQELRHGLLTDGRRERLTFDLSFQSSLPIWDLHKVGESQGFLGKGHIEQLGRVTGAIEIAGQRIQYDGMGNRDHSMGARDSSTVGSHQWMQGQFDNRVGFLIYDAVLRGQSTPVFCEAVVYDRDRMFEAKLVYPWRIDDARKAEQPYGFQLVYEHGTLDVAVEKFANTAYLSYTAPNEIYIGVLQQPAGTPLTLLEQSAHFKLNGSVRGHGHIERTVPGEIAVESF